MATPTNRQELKDYCLRALGAPVLEVNIDEDQLDDRVDEALQKYYDYHYDATERVYIPIQVTDIDLANGWFTLTDDIISVTRILPLSNTWSGVNMFNMKYQMYLNDFYALYRADSMQYYVEMQQYLSTLDSLLNGVQTIQYSRHGNRLRIEANLEEKIQPGQYIMVEGYRRIDNAEVWNDFWLKRYATSLIQFQWGANLAKFDGMQLPGGVTINARQYIDDAENDIRLLEEELRSTHELPVDFFCG
jgi:hypothetical protein